MLSIQDARSVLGTDAESMTDEEIQLVIDLLRGVCRCAIDEYITSKCVSLKDAEFQEED